MKANRTRQNGGILLFLALCTLFPAEVHAQTVVTFPDPNLEAAVREQLGKSTGPLTSLDLQSVTALNASQRSITNLSGLEWATNLTSLYLYANHLTDIATLTNLTAMAFLDVSINLLDLSPGSPALNVIQFLQARGASIQYLEQHQAPSIYLQTECSIAADVLSAISFQLYDDLEANGQLEITASSSNTNLVSNAGVSISAGDYRSYLILTPTTNRVGETIITLNAADQFGFASTASIRVEVVPAPVVTIPDPQLEAAIRSQLVKQIGPLTTLDLQSLQSLFAANKGITNLTGLEWATNLTTLNLGRNAITDLHPLANLRQLEKLWLDANNIQDASSLSGLTNLSYLLLTGNRIGNLTFVRELATLQYLYLGTNQITDTSALSSLNNLQWLDVSGNPVTNWNGVIRLTNLVGLMADGALNSVWLATPEMELDGSVRLTAFSATGLGLELQSSSDLSNWSALDAVTNLTGVIHYTDASARNTPLRYYRVHVLQ